MALPSTNLSKSEICVPSYTLSCLILYAHCLSFFCSSVPPSLPSVLPLSFPPSLYSHNKNFKIYWVSTECQSLYKLCCLVTAAVNSLQSCLTLCNPIDGSPPGSPVPRILQARTLEWVAISFSNAWKWKVKVKSLSRVRPSVTPWTAAYQAPPSIGFSRQEYWSGVPLPSLAWSLNPLNYCF